MGGLTVAALFEDRLDHQRTIWRIVGVVRSGQAESLVAMVNPSASYAQSIVIASNNYK
jgi:hypothetical protein